MGVSPVAGAEGSGPVVVLGAGYAGLRFAQEVRRRTHGRLPVVLVDRHPVHVLRTELYEVGRLARGSADPRRFLIPLDRLLGRPGVEVRTGDVTHIDLSGRTVQVNDARLDWGSLAICLGSVPAYYGVPGAAEFAHSVYRLSSALQLGRALRELEHESRSFAAGRRPTVVVVGGGSTGTEVAAEIATVDWTRLAGRGARPPAVTLVTGSVPLLAGLPDSLIAHARTLLGKAHVELVEGTNAAQVAAQSIRLTDGRTLSFDLCVWAAGVQAPEPVRTMAVRHGRSGRITVDPTLEIPGHPGVFVVGDACEVADPDTGVIAPATAQAAVAEAALAAANLVARRRGRPLEPFRYRERGVVVSVGTLAASATIRHLTLWGAPAKVIKRAVEREYPVKALRGAR
ncbi:MAG: FAD-dependent oxidoreductase [Thermoplasmata archaeon]|nr:FAD-dependent oxidoreductase [Thermoplasmata archaeon]